MKRPILILLSILVLSSLACGFTVNLPTAKVVDKQTMIVNEPYSDAKPTELSIHMGGGELTVQSGASQLVEGTIEYNIEKWKPEITRVSREVTIKQTVTNTIPFGDDVVNTWDLRLGKEPIDLTIEAGAYEGDVDLTGVPITRLKITDGAGESNLLFSAPNPVRMDSLTYETGASNITLEGLGYSDADVVNFKGGAGNFVLDFSGPLTREMKAFVDGGLGNITIKIPKGMNSRILLSTSLNTISTKGTWTVDNNEYRTNGEGPLLRIEVSVGVGNLNLVNE